MRRCAILCGRGRRPRTICGAKRQQLLSFLLRHGRIYSGGGHWTLAHRRWLAEQKFEHIAQQIVFQERHRRHQRCA